MRTVVALCGASGIIYGVEFLKRCPDEKFLILSQWARQVLKEETTVTEDALAAHAKKVYPDSDLTAPFASGSNPFDTYVIAPCTISTLAKISMGLADSLITRTAQVALKERRRMVIVLRETPVSSITLEHALRLSREGVIIMPAAPPFYKPVADVHGVVSNFVDKMLGVIGCHPPDGWRAEELE